MKTKPNNHRECGLVYFPWPYGVTRKSRFLNPSLRSFLLSYTFFPLLLYVWNSFVTIKCKAWCPFNKLRGVITRHVFFNWSDVQFSLLFFRWWLQQILSPSRMNRTLDFSKVTVSQKVVENNQLVLSASVIVLTRLGHTNSGVNLIKLK